MDSRTTGDTPQAAQENLTPSETDSFLTNSMSQHASNSKQNRALLISEETERKNIIRASQRSRRVDMSLELNNKKVCCCGPGWKRYIISILCCVCLTVVIGMRSEMLGIITQLNKAHLNFYNKTDDKFPAHNRSKRSLYQTDQPRRMPWMENLTADIVENALFFAYLFGSPFGGYLTVRHDSSLLLGGSTAMTCTLNLFLPLVEIIENDIKARICIIIILRILQGLAEGCLIPAVFGVLRFWGPESERSTLVCLAMIGVSLGPLIGLPICVKIEDHWGWGVVFYIYANIGLIWCIFWWRLVDERPIKDKSVSQVERLYLESTITKRLLMPTKPKVHIPWMSIFTSRPVFAILVTYAADDWTFQISSVCMQAYYYQIFKTDVNRTVKYLAFPFLSRSLFVPVGGFLADLLRLKTALPLTIIRKIFSILGFGLKGFFFIAMSFAQDEFFATIYLTLSLGFSGLAVAGYAVNVIDMSPEYAGLIMGFANSISTFTGILSTVIASLVVSNAATDDKKGWMIAFFLAAASQFFAAFCYLMFASCEEQTDWCSKNQYEEAHTPSPTDTKATKKLMEDIV